ncbi:MAG: hypothetical protein JXA67_05495 [Micromonosporaceae bacterium]|nr:hypothetical protein [Micromonosporaceae bacterium]
MVVLSRLTMVSGVAVTSSFGGLAAPLLGLAGAVLVLQSEPARATSTARIASLRHTPG